MSVMAREEWTDQRLDDLNERIAGIDQRMQDGFRGVGEEFRALRAEMRGEFQAVRAEMRGEFQAVRAEMRGEFQAVRSEMGGEFQAVRSEMGGEFQAVRSEMGALHRTTMQILLGGFATMLVGFATTIAAILATA